VHGQLRKRGTPPLLLRDDDVSGSAELHFFERIAKAAVLLRVSQENVARLLKALRSATVAAQDVQGPVRTAGAPVKSQKTMKMSARPCRRLPSLDGTRLRAVSRRCFKARRPASIWAQRMAKMASNEGDRSHSSTRATSVASGQARKKRLSVALGKAGRGTVLVLILAFALIGFLHVTRGTAVRHVRGVTADGTAIGVSQPEFALMAQEITIDAFRARSWFERMAERGANWLTRLL
jgi:hypothetical protein